MPLSEIQDNDLTTPFPSPIPEIVDISSDSEDEVTNNCYRVYVSPAPNQIQQLLAVTTHLSDHDLLDIISANDPFLQIRVPLHILRSEAGSCSITEITE